MTAHAEDRPRSVPVGGKVTLGYFGTVSPDCKATASEVKLKGGADHGLISVTKVKPKKGHIARCSDLAPEVSRLTFAAEPGYKGADTVIVEVTTLEKNPRPSAIRSPLGEVDGVADDAVVH